MRIAIEGQRLFREKKHGMDMVALELIKNLQEIDKENQYFVFVKPDQDKCLKNTDNFTIIELGGGAYPFWEQFSLPKAARHYNCDILHCTSNTAPVNTKIPLLVTLHDIIYLESISIFKKGGTWYQKVGNMYRRWNVPKVVRKSEKIITVSEFERDRIKKFFGFTDNRLVSVYNGVSEHFKPINDAGEIQRIKEKYKLPEKYLFHLGNTDPKKNTQGVLAAYASYLEIADEPLPLVMLDFDESILKRMLMDIGKPDLREKIHLTGYVVNTDLPVIYGQCSVFLYPSHRESFGIPILEAMRCGTPVITANTSSMPEISGGAAYIVTPHKPNEIASATIEILKNQNLRNKLVNDGLKRAENFSWRNMAVNVLELYKEVANNTKIDD